MGWAARAKVSAGNPTPPALKVRYMQASWFKQQTAQGRQVRATYSDRDYVMDAAGTLRRCAPVIGTTATIDVSPPTRSPAFTMRKVADDE